MIWSSSELSASNLSRATDIFVVDCCQFGPSWMFWLKMELTACANLVGGTTKHSYIFPWFYMIVSMLRNTYELSDLHLSRATAICVVDFCQFGPSMMFGIKMELISCSDLVGSTSEAKLYFSRPYTTVSMIWHNSDLSASRLIRATAFLDVDCWQIGPSWMFGMKMELMACADLVCRTT